MLEIRRAQPKDIQQLREISIQTQMDTFADQNTPEVMEAHIESMFNPVTFENDFYAPDSAYYIAWEGGEMAGFSRVRITDEAAEHLGTNALELHRIYVTKKFLGRGIGFALVKHAIDYARERKFEWLWLGVWEKNVRAQEFYAKCGFVRFAEHIYMMGHEPQNDWLLKFKL